MSNFKLIAISCIVLIIYWLEIDFLTPALIGAAESFNVPYKDMQSVISLDLLFRCLSMLVVGHLSDCIGRRKVINYSAWVVVFGSLLCCVANSFLTFSCGKIIQGVACSVSALSYAVISDNKSKKDSFFIISLIHFLLIIGMVVTPIIGSAIVYHYTWHGSFVVMLVFSVFACMLSYLLPKNESTVKKEFSFAKGCRNFFHILKQYSITKYVYMYSVLLGFTIGWTVEYPDFLMKTFGVKIQNIGYYQSVILLFSAFTNLYIGSFKSHINPLVILHKGVILCNVVSLLIIPMFFVKDVSVNVVVAFICFYACSVSMITCSAITFFYKKFDKDKGSATAVDVVIQNLIASFCVYAIVAFDCSSVKKLFFIMIVITFICNGLYFCKKR